MNDPVGLSSRSAWPSQEGKTSAKAPYLRMQVGRRANGCRGNTNDNYKPMKDTSKRVRMQDVLDSFNNQTHEIDDDTSRCVGPNREQTTLVKELFDSISAKLEPMGILVGNASVRVNPEINLTDARRQLEWLGFLDEQNKKDSPAPENLPIVE